jgi:hypothetical protein
LSAATRAVRPAPQRSEPVGRRKRGYVKQYQVTIDPDKLLAHKIPINKVVEQVRRGTSDTLPKQSTKNQFGDLKSISQS